MTRIEGIYGILPADLPLQELLEKAEAALRGGVQVLQLRDKKQEFKHLLERATLLHNLTTGYQARLIINDSIQIAVEAGAEGVHLGRSDASNILHARVEAGEGILMGVSCKSDIAFARQAVDSGADYISFGAIYATSSKSDASKIGIDRLAEARQLLPAANIIAIGGINLENLGKIKNAGADAAAVIDGLFGAEDIESRARRLLTLWKAAA